MSDFNPRSPRGLRLKTASLLAARSLYFNPRSPRGLRPYYIWANWEELGISIHAAQEGCDIECKHFSEGAVGNFNPRSPRGLRQYGNIYKCIIAKQFQSTQPKRAATFSGLLHLLMAIFQSTQPKRAATWNLPGGKTAVLISIHAAQEGCDNKNLLTNIAGNISIHAAQEGCDF